MGNSSTYSTNTDITYTGSKTDKHNSWKETTAQIISYVLQITLSCLCRSRLRGYEELIKTIALMVIVLTGKYESSQYQQ